MTNRERTMAVLNYENYDRLPIVHFAYWGETIDKWVQEKYLTAEEAKDYPALEKKLGFDYGWFSVFGIETGLIPQFKKRIIEEMPGGLFKEIDESGVINIVKPGVQSIPSQIDYTLKTRKDWEELYLPKLQFDNNRIDNSSLDQYTNAKGRENPIGVYCGSLYGQIRNWITIEGISYLYADDEELYTEIIDTVANLEYNCTKYALEYGCKPDYAQFWEDICFKNGPLVSPRIFREKVGHHYKRMTDLLHRYGINIIALDCDGCIDELVPIWFENGVNTMFPIEVGTWGGSIEKWRHKYGKALLGVGGMDKRIFAEDYYAVDREIERLKPLVELGGYLPCPDHRIAPDAKFENVQYYCDRMRKEFGG